MKLQFEDDCAVALLDPECPIENEEPSRYAIAQARLESDIEIPAYSEAELLDSQWLDVAII